MQISQALESAPFTPAQRGWLDGFLSGVLGLEQRLPNWQPALEAARTTTIYDRRHPYPAEVLDVFPLTGSGSAKDVRFVAFDLRNSGLTYKAGDSLGIFPENCPELVDLILAALGATGDEPVAAPDGRRVPARDALTRDYAITCSSDRLLTLLASSAADPGEARRLRELVEDDADGFLEGQDLHDLLAHFPSARPALGDLVASLAPIQPRLYSISSSPHAHPEEVHLTVSVVRYTKDGCPRVRKGVASTFLAERLRSGQKVRIFVQPAHGFGLPDDGAAPIIMVGPGTGIAPFRAFLQERKARRARGKSWLLFGDQHRASDFLYREELEEYLRSGVLTHLDTAFSRDQAAKIYVQHRLLENAPRLWAWLQAGAYFYICGDAKRMARDVDEALHRIVAEQGGMSAAEAKIYVAGLVRAKRYQRDVY
ncbi:MAG TPA: sulfite reductase subunit alpha [Herpetosiphonaceae bacterium]|nr:sulfite reductase subunit alpha [Herpetosiphonaceae bacterium]